jgi:hypothetical protein
MQLVHQASLATFFTPDYLTTALGFSMSVRSSRWAVTGFTQPNEDPQTSASLTFPAIATDTTIARTYWSDDCDSVLDFFDVALYMNHNANWELHIGLIEWRLNGELLGSWGGITRYSTMVPTPMAIPIMPGAMSISASASCVLGEPTGIPLPAHTEGEMVSTGHIGFRYMQNGVWYSPPITFPEPFVPAPAPYGLDGILLGGNMWDGVIRCRNYKLWDYAYTGQDRGYDTYRYDNISEGASASATIIPDLPKSVERLNDDYAAVVFRGGFPETFAEGRLVDLVFRPEYIGRPPPWYTIEERRIHKPYTQFLSTVQNATHLIEEPMNQPTLSQCNISRSYFDFTRWNELVVPIGTTQWPWIGSPPMPPWAGSPQVTRKNGGVYYTFPNRIVRSQTLSYLSHFVDRVEYFNTWANPHWSYLLWFAPEEAPASVQWKIDGAPVTAQEYWLQARQQHVDHPALPSGERLKIRNHIITEPLWQNGLSGLIEANVFGQFTSWWGISRFIADPITPISSVAFDARSAPAWISDDATLAFGAGGVTVTPNAGKSTIVVDLDVGRFGEFPFMIPHTATEMSVGWNGPELLTGKASQIGAEGSAAQVTTTPGRFRKVLGGSKKYAGTWRQDYGVGYTDDTGVDLYDRAKKSMSDAIMSDNERVFSFGLLPARGFDKLRFEMTIEPTTPQPFTITFPVFHNAWNVSDLQFIREAAYFTSILTPDGPWWRYGVWTFYNPFLGLLNPPAVSVAEGMPTALDWLATKRVALLGRSAFDLMYEEISTLYDVNIEWTQVKHLAADPFQQTPVTHSFVLKGRNKIVGAMVNSYAETPPLAGWPGPTRGLNYEIVGGYSQKAYSLITTRQWLVHPGDLADPVNRLVKPPLVPENNRITNAPPCSGYLGGYHHDVVDGSEQIDWRVRLAWNGKDVDFARVRPWHGYLWVPGDSAASLFAFRMCRDEHLGFVHAVIPSSPGVKLRSWDETKGVDRERDVTDEEAQIAGIAWSQGSRQLVVVYCNTQPDGSVIIKRTASDSQGLKWSTPEMLWEGNGADDEFDSAGREFVSYWKDGKFRIKYRRAEGEAWQGPFDIADSEDEGTTAVTVAPFAGAPVVVLTAVKKADDTLEIRRFESTSSGRTWRETT